MRDIATAVEATAEALIVVWGRAQEAPGIRVSPVQLRALTIVERHDAINVNGLAEELGAIPSSASRLCDRLEAAGLLARDSRAADRREVNLRLTHDGRMLLAELRERRRQDLAEILGAMTPPARAALVEGLTEFARAVGLAGPGPGDADVGRLPA